MCLPFLFENISVLVYSIWLKNLPEVKASTSIPASRAIRNGIKPLEDQSLSRIAYLLEDELDEFDCLANVGAPKLPLAESNIASVFENRILLRNILGERAKRKHNYLKKKELKGNKSEKYEGCRYSAL